uniref:P/Homo B domain-containing protein n=1 Tax=Parastrongyloides trichosuri TaxID=131310 RepID=A0A0N4ZFP6_PARTI
MFINLKNVLISIIFYKLIITYVNLINDTNIIIIYFKDHNNATEFGKSLNLPVQKLHNGDCYIKLVEIKFKNEEELKKFKLSVEKKHNGQVFIEKPLIREKRIVVKDFTLPFNDNNFINQWYILNEYRISKTGNVGMGILDAWSMGYTGKGVVVTIVDDGVDYNHEDLIDNYLPIASFNYIESNYDPSPPLDVMPPEEHGTNCAGLIAMKENNNKCGVGIAFGAKFGAIRLIDKSVSQYDEASAFIYQGNITDIYTSSWGPLDDGTKLEHVHGLVEESIKYGVMYNRKGKGSIFVFASGNGGIKNDSCAMDGLISHVFTFPVSAVSPFYTIPNYAEKCSTALISTFSNGHTNGQVEECLFTTSLNNKCGFNSLGTSAAAPIFAAIVALTLEANKNLTWRDIKYITILSADPIPMLEKSNHEWIKNGAGFLHNPYFGFGLANAKRMINKAKKWEHVPSLYECKLTFKNFEIKKWAANKVLQGSFKFNACNNNGVKINVIEYVQLRITTFNQKRGAIQLWLTSPSNTTAQLIYDRHFDKERYIDDYAFNSVVTFGENPEGVWTFELLDSYGYGYLKNISFVVFGTHDKSKYLMKQKRYGKSIDKKLETMKRNFVYDD